MKEAGFVTIQIDDAGWGDPIGGVLIGIFRVETQEYLVHEIEVSHFQPPNFTKKTFLKRGLELVQQAFSCFNVDKKEPIEVCRGAVLDGVRDGLVQQGYTVIPKKIEGQLQEQIEASLVESLRKLGIPDIPRVSGKDRFFRQLEWIQKDLKNREQFAKTGWKNWPTKLRQWRPSWRRDSHKVSPPPVIIKLGGSIISDKTRPSTPQLEVISKLVHEISGITSHPIVVVHGGGSYGHFPAKKYQLHRGGRSKKKKRGVTETASEMSKLNQLILDAFHAASRPAVPIRTLAIMVALNGRIAHMDLEALRTFLHQNFIPILSGDVVADSVTGFTIISGDQIAMYLARQLHSTKVIFATDVDGLYTADPKTSSKAKRIPLVTPKTLDTVLTEAAMGTATDAADVTLGMRGKLEEIFKGLPPNCEAIICDLRKPGTLARIIEGKSVSSTRLRLAPPR